MRKFFTYLIVFLLLIGVVAFLAGFYYINRLKGDLPDISLLEQRRPALTSKIVSTDGQTIAALYEENRSWTKIDGMSPYVIDALLATEDSRFFEHSGVDYKGVIRAVVVALSKGQAREGASTITMQLARNVFLSNERTIDRKLKEMLLSHQLEEKYSKQQILEFYLNEVFFGSQAYGIHAASNTYFSKGPKELTATQAAMIAGLVQAPSRYNPFLNPDLAKERTEHVLQRMRDTGKLSVEQYDLAKNELDGMVFSQGKKESESLLLYPYFTSYVIKQLSKRYGEEQLYRHGWQIATTLDPGLQKVCQRVLADQLYLHGYELDASQGAVVVLENKTGFVRAMVGGAAWSVKDQFNRAWQTRRQPGSSFKPIVYAAALENGWAPESTVKDEKISFNDGTSRLWTPKNSDGNYAGTMTVRKALTQSRNVIAVKLLADIGADVVVKLAYEMGIRSKISPNLSLALGATSASPLEMAGVYKTIANRGVYSPPVFIKTITDEKGELIHDFRHPDKREVLSKEVCDAMISMMQDVVRDGTGTRAFIQGIPIAGKTGTTDDFRDAWFVGFSPEYTVAVWIGNDDNHSMYYSYGGDLPARIFREIMLDLYRQKDPGSFPAYYGLGSSYKNDPNAKKEKEDEEDEDEEELKELEEREEQEKNRELFEKDLVEEESSGIVEAEVRQVPYVESLPPLDIEEATPPPAYEPPPAEPAPREFSPPPPPPPPKPVQEVAPVRDFSPPPPPPPAEPERIESAPEAVELFPGGPQEIDLESEPTGGPTEVILQ